jgi:hypothetical protein
MTNIEAHSRVDATKIQVSVAEWIDDPWISLTLNPSDALRRGRQYRYQLSAPPELTLLEVRHWMDARKRQLVVEHALGRISTDSFVSQLGVDPRTDHEFVRQELEGALEERSGPDVECAMILAHQFGLSASWAPLLCELLRTDWHFKHEDIASALQDIRDPSTVDVLYDAALKRHPYLDYDDAFALAVKCIWALHDIGTAAAKEKLVLLTQSDNEVIRRNASRRLSAPAARQSGEAEAPYRRARDGHVRRDR